MRLVRQSRAVHSGFTLVELLIVLGIIIILVTLSAAAIIRFGRIGGVIATENNLRKISAALQQQWQAVRDQANRGTLPDGITRKQYVKAQLRAAFPDTLAEAFSYGHPAYQKYLAKYGITNPAQIPEARKQKAILLLMILQAGPSNAGLSADTLGNTAVQTVTSQTGASAPGCVDGWGNELWILRYPPTLAVDDLPTGMAVYSIGSNGWKDSNNQVIDFLPNPLPLNGMIARPGSSEVLISLDTLLPTP
jgi:type II secretory pathway pseudopilin PulG